MVFLDRPEAIEEKGGYVPGGILLWGRPGTARRSWPRPWPARPASPTCSSTPAPSSTCSWASASSRSRACSASCASWPALRQRHRVLRRGRLPRQPRLLAGGGGFGQFSEACGHPRRGKTTCAGCRPSRAVLQSSLEHASTTRATPRLAPDHDGRHGHGRRWRHAPGPAVGDVRPEEAQGLPQPVRPPPAGHEAQAPAQVPHPHHDGDEHARLARRGHAAPGRIDRIYKVGYPSKEGASAPTRATSPR